MNTGNQLTAIDIIPIIISAVALLISITTALCQLISQTKRLHFRVIEYSESKKWLIFYLQIENKSRLPISITRITWQGFDCCVFPTEVVKLNTKINQENLGIISENNIVYKTMPLPINLSTLAGVSGYVAFWSPQGTFPKLSRHVTFQVCTNRGKIKECRLSLPYPGIDHLHTELS